MPFIEYMCRYCGAKMLRSAQSGKPSPGKCPRKTGDRPHSWIINRRLSQPRGCEGINIYGGKGDAHGSFYRMGLQKMRI